MTDRGMIKTLGGLIPNGTDDGEWFAKIRNGQSVAATIRIPRNGKFHQKFFVMLRCAYDNHEWPEIQTQWGPAKCTYNQFRKYITVKAGFYEMVVTPTGDVRADALSISFAKMTQDEFDELYSNSVDVILKEFLSGWTCGDMDNAVRQILDFT